MLFTKKKRKIFTILVFLGSLILVASSLVPLFYAFR